MYYSFLDEIDKYIKEKGIPFKNIIVNYSYFPDVINQVILDQLRKSTSFFELGVEEYILEYDKIGNLYLHAKDKKCVANVIISNCNNLSVDFSFGGISEKRLLEEAYMLRTLEEERMAIREDIKKMDLSLKDKVLLENKRVRKMATNNYYRLRNSGISILDLVDYQEELEECVDKIKKYIDYLNKMYQEDVTKNNDVMKGICYLEPKKDTVIRRDKGVTSDKSKERINPVIEASARLEILDSYDYLYKDYAYTNDSREISYMNYLYEIDDEMYVLIMEPYNGIKYTKIAVFKYEEMNEEVFREAVKSYLELSASEFMMCEGTSRSSHTSLNTFRGIINYTLVPKDTKLVSPGFKKKIRSIKDEIREI